MSNITISTDKSKLNLSIIHQFLSASYWAEGIPFEVVRKAIEHSLCFGVYDENQLVGFARVVSDFSTFAYLADVFILESHRGRGLAKRLMADVINHPELQGLRRFSLATKDAHGLYRQFGFTELSKSDRQMEIVQVDMYKTRG
jgi:GNAT superfamily N-acetyltransferase